MTQKKPLAPCHAIFNFPAPLLFSCIPPNKGLFWKSCLGICFWCGERQTLIRHLGVIFFAQTAVTRMFSPSLFSVGKTDIEESNSSLKSYMWSFRSDRGPLQRLSLTGSGGKAVLPGQSGCTVWRELLSTARYRHLPSSPRRPIWRPYYWGALNRCLSQVPLPQLPYLMGLEDTSWLNIQGFSTPNPSHAPSPAAPSSIKHQEPLFGAPRSKMIPASELTGLTLTQGHFINRTLGDLELFLFSLLLYTLTVRD